MLTEKIIMNKQEEQNQKFEFYGVPIVCTPNFLSTFGGDYMMVAFVAQALIAETYPNKNWDYLQTFQYKGIDFWCISDALQDQVTQEPHITFLMPEDY